MTTLAPSFLIGFFFIFAGYKNILKISDGFEMGQYAAKDL